MRNDRVTMKVLHGTAGPVHELPWLWRKIAVRLVRRMLRRGPMEGLPGVDCDGRPIWADGYPEALTQR